MTGAQANEPVVSYLEKALGLSFDGPRRTRLLASIDAQRAAARLTDDAYLAAVSQQGLVFDRLVADITVGETYFFRDRVQCQLLRHVVFPELAERTQPEQRLALWSAGCASGEEAFTLAALAEEAGLGARCSVVGSDVSTTALDKARRAEYGAWSMRSTTPAEQRRYFYQQHGRFHVVEELRKRATFVQRNLLDGPPPPGLFDVVLCRNLLIYLNRPAVARAAAVLSGALAVHGWLITAAGDPPLDAPGLEAVRTRFGLAYRRRSAAPPKQRRVVDVSDRAAVAASSPPRSRPRRHGDLRRPAPSPKAAPVRTEMSTAGSAPSAAALAEQVRALGNAGRLTDACNAAVAAVQAHPLDVELRYLGAVVLFEAGRLEEAADAAASAVYLGSDLPAAHLLLGQVEHARGNLKAARRSFRNGSRLLAGASGEAAVELVGDLPAGHLRAVAARLLDSSGHSR